MPIHNDSIPKTAIVTPFSTFEFLRMPFGIVNAGSTFQSLIDYVLSDLDCVFCYIDNVLIFSSS